MKRNTPVTEHRDNKKKHSPERAVSDETSESLSDLVISTIVKAHIPSEQFTLVNLLKFHDSTNTTDVDKLDDDAMGRSSIEDATTTLLSDINPHERDERIRFRESDHKYWIDDDCDGLVSSTGLIKKYFSEFDAFKISRMCSRTKNENSKYYGKTPEAIRAMWKSGTDAGTDLHAKCEAFMNRLPVRDNSVEFEYFLNFVRDHINQIEPYRTEQLIYSDLHRVTGSIDFLAKVKGSDNDFVIMDWKRSADIKFKGNQRAKKPLQHLYDTNWSKYCLQQSLYRYILEEFYGMNVIDCYLIVLHSNNDNYLKLKCLDLRKEIAQLFKHRLDTMFG